MLCDEISLQRTSRSKGNLFGAFPGTGIAPVRRGKLGALPQQGRIGIPKQGHIGDRQCPQRFPVIAILETEEPRLFGLPAILPVVEAHLQRDLDCRCAVAAVETMRQSRQCRQSLGKLHHGLVGEARQDYVLEPAELVGQCSVDPWVGVSEKIDPPGTDRVEVAVAVEVIQPHSIAARDRHQRHLLVMLHLRAGMPHGAQAAGEQILVARKIGIHRDAVQEVARLDMARSKTLFT